MSGATIHFADGTVAEYPSVMEAFAEVPDQRHPDSPVVLRIQSELGTWSFGNEGR